MTRPLTLLEILMKLILKIIVKRLNRAFVRSKILQGNNSCALPGLSTNDPIKLVSAVFEDARRNKKKSYTLFQDMKRAFDMFS